MATYLLIIQADIGDADYIYSYNVIEESDIPIIKRYITSTKVLLGLCKGLSNDKYSHPLRQLEDNLQAISALESWDKEGKYYQVDDWFEEEIRYVYDNEIRDYNLFNYYFPTSPDQNAEIHTINDIRLYRLADDKPINLWND